MGAVDLDQVAGELYGLRPGEFTARRDAHAAEARRAGQRELGQAVKALRRPTTSAWLANVLAHQRPEKLAELLELGATMRQDQGGAGLSATDLRRLARDRHRLVAALVEEARRCAADAGEAVSSAAAKELEDTLEATVFDADASAAVRSGRLTAPLRYSGLGPVDLSGAVNAPGPAPTSSAPSRPRTGAANRGREARSPDQTLAAAEEELRQAEAAAAEAEAELRAVEGRLDEARKARDEAHNSVAGMEQELERRRQVEDQAARAVRDVEKEHAAAERAHAAAEKRASEARSTVRGHARQ